MGSLVGSGAASLLELERDYSYRDALDMAEILRVKHYNEWVSMEQTNGDRC